MKYYTIKASATVQIEVFNAEGNLIDMFDDEVKSDRTLNENDLHSTWNCAGCGEEMMAFFVSSKLSNGITNSIYMVVSADDVIVGPRISIPQKRAEYKNTGREI
jgi:hypothetical protein